METECPYLRNATQLAHQKGLLPKKQMLMCELEGKCDYVDCQKIEQPAYRTVYFKQNVTGKDTPPLEKFYKKIKESLQIIRERG